MLYLLDTNVCIAAMRNHPQVVQRMPATSPADCFVSTVTSYELYTRVAKCAAPDKERPKVEVLLKTLVELPFDPPAAREASRIRALLESQGHMIGPYDVLLTGQAIAGGLTLVTDNTNEFGRIPGLMIENWQHPTS